MMRVAEKSIAINALDKRQTRFALGANMRQKRRSHAPFSNRPRFGENLRANPRRQLADRHQVDRHAEHSFQVFEQTAEIKQRRPGNRIDEDIEIRALDVLAARDRTKHTRVRSRRLSVGAECLRDAFRALRTAS